MKTNRLLLIYFFCIIGAAVFEGCGHKAPKLEPPTAYLNHMPQSILVLPPKNESTEVQAPYIYLSTITKPIAEKGYYVYPVAVIDHFMKENGVPTPEDMAQVPLEKIKEIIGPDAVLYITIKDWGTKYQVLSSVTVVQCEAQLVDTDTKTVLWKGAQRISCNPNQQNANGLAEALVAAIVSQIVNSMVDPSRDVARMANNALFLDPKKGLLYGKRNLQYENEQKKWRDYQNQVNTAPSEEQK